MAHRYFTTQIEDGVARLTGEDARHLAGVLRARPGDAVLVCDGAGTDYTTEVLAAGKDEVRLAIKHRQPTRAEPSIHIEVFVGLAKGERMDYAVQKAVELGAAALWPFTSAHTVARAQNPQHKTQRWQRIATEAAKQSGRGVLPVVHPPLAFDAMLEEVGRGGFDDALFCYEKGGSALRQIISRQRRLAVITGAEGGFSPAEAEQAVAAGCTLVGLGPRILRCETAPAAVLAAVLCLRGDLEDAAATG